MLRRCLHASSKICRPIDVKNLGNGNAGYSTTTYNLTGDGWVLPTQYLKTSNISSGSSQTVISTSITLGKGSYSVLACADYGNYIIESDEKNNCQLADFKIY